ncbi:MAG: radical SAM family heme chaperone HemW [Spirochaetales bacterium]|nr:radical SAM family heme chaperone HemW [Spirochaetales bacterium]
MGSLYIHIPFCTSRCAYCTFYSEVYHENASLVEPYHKRLLAELSVLVDEQELSFDTVYIGGGNPGLLGVERLVQLLKLIHTHGRPREVTMEINPETLTEEFLPLFEDRLLTRLSIGIQSMDDRFLRRIGRNTASSANERALRLAERIHDAYDVELSVDLIVAIPGQTISDLRRDLDRVLKLCAADHISLYCLTVEEGSRLFEQGGIFMSDDEQASLLYELWAYLKELGYEHYEVSNFAREGRYSQHNLIYWKLGTCLGLGSGAASTTWEAGTLVHHLQEQDLRTYAREEPFTGYEKEVLTTVERIEEELMVGLRTRRGIDKASFLKRTGHDFSSLFDRVVATLDSTWYDEADQFFSLTEHGFMVLDAILLRFFASIPEALDRSQWLW